MCLVRSWNTGLEAMCRAAWLSQNNDAGLECLIPMSLNKCRSHNTSQTVTAMALYSSSANDLEMVLCFLDFHEIKESPIKT